MNCYRYEWSQLLYDCSNGDHPDQWTLTKDGIAGAKAMFDRQTDDLMDQNKYSLT